MPNCDFALSLSQTPLCKSSSDLLLLPCFAKAEGKDKKVEKTDNFPESFELLELDPALLKQIKKICQEEDFQARAGSAIYLPYLHQNYKRILVCGLGEMEKAKSYTIERSLLQSLNSSIKLKDIKKILAPIEIDSAGPIRSNLLAFSILAAFSQFSYRSRESLKPGPKIAEISFHQKAQSENPLSLEKLKEWKNITLAPALAMDLVNSPPNLKSTATLAEEAKKLQKNKNIKLHVQENINWIQKKMPCFFTVARGSLQSDPPRWIHLSYKPSKKASLCFVLVGKSVMFDTGGYQLKPDSYMNTMKADMTGGATVLAVFQALEKLNLKNLELHGMLAATPNMVDSNAFVPDSIVNSACGKKVEIHHTDAEGRLTLIDAVSMAQEQRPDLILTIATLTGAASRAVGPRTALMSNNPFWQMRYEEAAEIAGEALETLSVEAEDFESIESKLDSADIINDSHNKYRGAQTAAAFILSGIRKEQALVHLDIAGGDLSSEGKATGIAVKALLQFLLQENNRVQ